MRVDIYWTIEQPKITGWYWAYEDYGDYYAIEMVEVIINAQEEPYVLSPEHDGRMTLDYWDAWLGPIKVPEPPYPFPPFERHNHNITPPECEIHHIPRVWVEMDGRNAVWECPECEKEEDEDWNNYMGENGIPRDLERNSD